MKTLNGDRNSAVKVIDLMQAEGENRYKNDEDKQFISDSVRYKIRQTNEHNVYRKVFLKYLLLRIRSKISFHAFKKKMTIVELFSNTILKCWYDLEYQGFYPKLTSKEKQNSEELMKYLNNGEIAGFMKHIVKYNVM